MTTLKIDKNWRIIAIVLTVVVVVYMLGNFLILPKAESWVLSKIPGSAAVQKALEARYPDNTISIYMNTNYGSDNQERRTLTVGISGHAFLTPAQAADAGSLICSALGQDAQKYDAISLRSSAVHNFLFFNSSQSQTQPINCK